MRSSRKWSQSGGSIKVMNGRMTQAVMRKERSSAKRAGGVRKAAGGGTLTEKAYRELEELIVTLRLKPGEFLSEYALSNSLKIGRTPIREALQRLSREDLVTILPRKGILVSATDPRQAIARAGSPPRTRTIGVPARRPARDRRATRPLPRDCDQYGSRRQDQRRHHVHASRPRVEFIARRGGAERLCNARDAISARPFPALLVPALQTGGGLAAVRAAARQSSACGRRPAM